MISGLFLILYIVTGIITCIYCLLLLRGLSRGRLVELNEDQPPVSIIIAGHNEAHHLENLFKALLEQDYPQFEVVFVNDRSTDTTQQLLEEHSAIRHVIITETPSNIDPKKYALQQGIKMAKHDLLLLTDADCLPRSNQWISTMVAHNTSGIVLGLSFYKKYPELLNYFIRYETLLTALQYCGWAGLGHPYMGVGRNLMYQKSMLKDEHFSSIAPITGGDDDLLIQQLANTKNTTICLSDQGQTVSEPEKTIRSYFTQKVRHLSVGKHYAARTTVMLGVFQASYLANWLLLLVVLLLGNELYLIGVSFIIRTLCWYFTFYIAKKQVNIAFDLWGLLVLEVLYIPYYLITGIMALLKKDVKWI